MAVLDLLGRRWSLRILWELHMSGPSSFRDLQRLCGDISPTVLNTRLAELRDTGIIELRDKGGYVITEQGLELGAVILQLRDWAERWAGSLDPSGPGGKAGLETTGRKGK
jgi:DNA-binding HxlR family transcriptional regulator